MWNKCLYLNNSPDPKRGDMAKIGGGGRSLLTLWTELPGLEWHAHAVLPAEGPMTTATRAAGIPCTIYPYAQPALWHPWQTLRNLRSWQRIIRDTQPTIIHSNSPDPARSAALAASREGKKLICHLRWPPSPEGIPWLFRGLPKPAAFIFNSHAMREEIWPRLSQYCPHSQAVVIHNAVDLGAFRPSPWPEVEPRRVGIVANLMPAKSHEDFLAMARSLIDQDVHAEFWVIGDDTLGLGRREALETMARDLGIADHVQFLGHRDNIAEIISQLHVTVVTSRVEPFGRVLIESMACSRPVVATRVGGIPEVIRDGETGYLVEPGDHEGMAARVKELLTDRELWKTMSARGLQDVKQRFSVASHARAIVDVYESLLA